MVFGTLALLVRAVAQVFIWVVIASALLSFFLPPYHAVRVALDRIVNPLLAPIRRVLPSTGVVDFSPLVLVLAVLWLSRVVASLLLSLR
jgi:YggT family protein